MQRARGVLFCAAASDRGRRRAVNEDHFIVADLRRREVTMRRAQRPVRVVCEDLDLPGVLLAVADGLGGYDHGELASRIAVQVLVQTLWAPEAPALIDAAQLVRAVEAAHHAVYQQRQTLASDSRMATTLTAALISPGVLTLAHVGDSRAYHYHQGCLTLLSEDQTLVNLLCKQGMLTEAEARSHPHRHVLWQALGQETPAVAAVQCYPLADGDRVLLCTDGLSSYVPTEHIARILATEPDEPRQCQALIDAANAAGGADNVTVIVARYHSLSATTFSAREMRP